MDITRENFREKLPELYDSIAKANFFAIDCEFTGISTENNIYPYDRPEDAYKKTRENTCGYILIQLGITVVREENAKFSYKSYNFYVFPRTWRQSFRCQGSSMTFLADNGFDFAKLFRHGISYCDKQEEKNLRERLQDKQKQRKDNLNAFQKDLPNHIPVPEGEKEAIEKITETVEEFLKSDESEKVIGDCNAYQRKLIYEMLEAKFPQKIHAFPKVLENKKKVIIIQKKKSPEEEQHLEEERQQKELEELEDSIGMSIIMQKISESKKPIIGHNMMLDLCYIFRQFFGPLPEDFGDFKRFAHSIFPNIIDTKYMCTLEQFKTKIKSSVLADLVKTIATELHTSEVLVPECDKCSYTTSNNKEHEAGYDSYLTALAFLGLTKHLEITPDKIYANSPDLQLFLNRVFLMKLQDVCYINLIGPEPTPKRDHVFHVTIPEVWRQSDLVNHFKSFGPIYITWINSTTALISLNNKENSKAVLRTIGKYPGFKVQSFSAFRESLQKRRHISEENVEAKKRKHNDESSSGGSKARKLTTEHNKEEPVKAKEKLFAEFDNWS